MEHALEGGGGGGQVSHDGTDNQVNQHTLNNTVNPNTAALESGSLGSSWDCQGRDHKTFTREVGTGVNIVTLSLVEAITRSFCRTWKWDESKEL